MSYKISELYIYPIKSLGRIQVQKSVLTPKGLQYDRRWVLTDVEGQFITQRAMPELVFFKIQLTEKGLLISHKDAKNDLLVSIREGNETDSRMDVTVWGDTVSAIVEPPSINKWFSELLGFEVYLSFLPDTDTQRKIRGDETAAINFPDACPYLVLGQEALNHLNNLLDVPIPINRFRANIIFEGGTPHLEDEWTHIQIGGGDLKSVKTCARCQVITTNQETGMVGKEPLRTLATYRRDGNRILFGRYFKLEGNGGIEVKVGDEIKNL